MLELKTVKPSSAKRIVEILLMFTNGGIFFFSVLLQTFWRDHTTARVSHINNRCVNQLSWTTKNFFHPIPIAAGTSRSKKKENVTKTTTPISHHGTYRLTHMMFGFKCASVAIKRVENVTMETVKGKSALVYEDRFATFSNKALSTHRLQETSTQVIVDWMKVFTHDKCRPISHIDDTV